jgi:DNA-binding response OmpR family regulator
MSTRVRTPILILSRRAKLDHKIKRFGFCADDFLTKPFGDLELVARILATVRRSNVGHSDWQAGRQSRYPGWSGSAEMLVYI